MSREGEDKATFTCEFDRGEDDYWMVDDVCYKCTTSPDDIEPEINGCLTKNGTSVFYLKDLKSFCEGELSLVCVLHQNTIPTFKKDDTSSMQGSRFGFPIYCYVCMRIPVHI